MEAPKKFRKKPVVVVAMPGDWIVRDVSGKYYPCLVDIFEATYEEV